MLSPMSVRAVRLPSWLFPLAVLLLTVLPLVELALLVLLGRSIGLVPTLLICASTGFLGAWLARAQGLRTLLDAQQAMAEGRFPAEQVLDGAFLLAGGVVLLTPGLITDALGFTLLLPPGRALLKGALRRWWSRQTGVVSAPAGAAASTASGEPEIVEGEVLEEETVR